MPSVLGVLFMLFGAWFIYQAIRRRREALTQPKVDAESAPFSSNSEKLQQFASGCAPIVAMGIVMAALGVSAVALIMNNSMEVARRIPILDILGLLFFAGAFAFSLLTQTYYSSAYYRSDEAPPPSDTP